MKYLSPTELRRRDGLRRKRERLRLRRQNYRRMDRTAPSGRVRREEGYRPVFVSCPPILDVTGTDDVTRRLSLAFFRRLHSAWSPTRRQHLVVDMRPCERISVASALVLTAELEVLRMKYPKQIDGIDPDNERPKRLLEAVGFHQYLKYRPDDERPKPSDDIVVEIRRGGLEVGSPGLGQAGAAVTSILETVYGDSEEVAQRQSAIHRAVNEGLLNVRHHAYASKTPSARKSHLPSREHQWWALGIVFKETNTLGLVIYDRGVGIPNTLSQDVADYAVSILTGKKRDQARLQAAMQYGRTSRVDAKGKSASGGSGLPQMVNLVSDYPGSMIVVESAGARYIKAERKGLEGAELCLSISPKLNGTLVIWDLHLDGQEWEIDDDDDL